MAEKWSHPWPYTELHHSNSRNMLPFTSMVLHNWHLSCHLIENLVMMKRWHWHTARARAAARTQGAAAGGQELGDAFGPGGRRVAHREAAGRARAAPA